MRPAIRTAKHPTTTEAHPFHCCKSDDRPRGPAMPIATLAALLALLEKLRALRLAVRALPPGPLRDAYQRDCVAPNLELLAALCAAIEETDDPNHDLRLVAMAVVRAEVDRLEREGRRCDGCGRRLDPEQLSLEKCPCCGEWTIPF